jgi:3-hydroxyisobutyrate dehydrogenase-like beta-hydroxyacid dehydrogenase
MVGGDQSAFEKAKPYLELMGKLFLLLRRGREGSAGQADAESGALANIMQAFREGMVLATKGGIAPA